MRIVKTITQLRKIVHAARQEGNSVAFIPTMGALHEGHLSLVRQAKMKNDFCVVSIFVNPTQFSPNEDLAKYPRDLKRDSSMLLKENVDILFFPSNNVIYPERYLTYIDVKNISRSLCGKFRPGHFTGVATVVAKLLNIVQPDQLYLGQKDAQQVVVIKQMIEDLNFPVKVKVVETKREADGLAMSSRNQYLSSKERSEASILYQSLQKAKVMIKNNERSPLKIENMIRSMIKTKTSGKIQYVECVNADSLDKLKSLKGNILIALAVFFGKTRLIDNVLIPIHEKK